ncbi:hypothetical protein L1887_20372 [Cichorium endivia]|nr:hypothetical protein L1887_20372 [Cichorium endivia]
MKVIEKSKTKKRKGAEKDSNKSLRKDKSAMGNEAKPQVKRHKLGKVEGQKKNEDSKAYPPGLRRLNSRMTHGKISLTFKTLSETQKEAVKRMGFGSLLGMDINSILWRLNYVLLDNYDPTRNRLKVNKEWITTSKELVHDIMGLPMAGENIKELEACPITLLLLTYVYSVKVLVKDLKNGRPFIRYVRNSHLEEIEVEEINQNELGMGYIEQRSVADGETSNTDMDLQQVLREYGNVEGDDVGINDEGYDVGINDEGDEGGKDKDIESNIAKHVKSGGVASVVNVNVRITNSSRVGEYQAEELIPEREVYNTPKTVAYGECEDYSGTRFLEDPVVLEQVLDVLDKTSERYYEGRVSGSSKMEGNVEMKAV